MLVLDTDYSTITYEVKAIIRNMQHLDASDPMIATNIANISKVLADVPYNELPNPHVACNEWPNAPWNTVQYEWDATYAVCTPEWFAQHTAKSALKYGIQYGTRDRAKEQKANLDAYLIARGDKKPACVNTPAQEKETPVMQQTQRPIAINIAVLADDFLYFCPDAKLIKRKVTVQTPFDILQIAMDVNVHAVWVLPETNLSKNATKEWCEGDNENWGIKNRQYTNCGHATSIAGYKKKEARSENETGKTITIMFPEWGHWNLDEVTNPITLLGAVSYLEDVLGERIDCQPMTYGRRLMIGYNENNTTKGWIQPVNIHKAIPEKIQAVDCMWTKKLDESALNAMVNDGLSWLAVYDKNSQYPGACTGTKLGVGTPVHEMQPTFDVKSPLTGLYHCKITGESPEGFDGVQLPHPTDGRTEGWFLTYTVQLLFELGYTVEIEEAYVWKESHVIMRVWAEKLWNCRSQLQTGNPLCNVTRYKNQAARDAAYQAIKPILNASLGMLASGKHKQDLDKFEAVLCNPDATEKDRQYATLALSWYRPDWYALIIDRARTLMFRRIKKFQGSGSVLLGVQTDALFYATSTPDHDQALPSMMDRATLLGGFKRKFKKDIRLEDISEQLTKEKADIRLINSFLKGKDEE